MQERHRPKEPIYRLIMPKTEAESALVFLGSIGGGGVGTIAGPVGALIGIPVGAAVATGLNVITRRSRKVA